jgi:hypothetical protein
MGRKRPIPEIEKDPDKYGDPILRMIEPEQDETEFWYDFLHLDWKEIVALALVAAWLLYCVYTYN